MWSAEVEILGVYGRIQEIEILESNILTNEYALTVIFILDSIPFRAWHCCVTRAVHRLGVGVALAVVLAGGATVIVMSPALPPRGLFDRWSWGARELAFSTIPDIDEGSCEICKIGAKRSDIGIPRQKADTCDVTIGFNDACTTVALLYPIQSAGISITLLLSSTKLLDTTLATYWCTVKHQRHKSTLHRTARIVTFTMVRLIASLLKVLVTHLCGT
jgi:hypothetical protein